MRIDATTPAVLQAAQPAMSAEQARLRLQTMLLKKNLESQQEQAAEILRQVEGKGGVLDIQA
jgi:hypothetical protein